MWEIIANLLAPGPARATLGLRLVVALVACLVFFIKYVLLG
jgi:succinate dehydrogenase hydrophobic anchor subunit